MPNHTKNILRMRNIGNLPLYTDDDQHEFDFNKIIPMNEDLNIVDGSITDVSIRECLRYVLDRIAYPYFQGISNPTFVNMIECLEESKDLDRQFIKNDEELNDLVSKGFNYISNVVKYGYPTWYEWCNANWGTKWNAYDTTTIDDNEIEFYTAWSEPDPIFIELSKMYPYDEINVTSAYEGDFCIRDASYLGGDCIEAHYSELIEQSDPSTEKYNRELIRRYYQIRDNYDESDGYYDPYYQELENEIIADIQVKVAKRDGVLINLVERIGIEKKDD